MDDAELLAQYAADRSQVAFAELVRRQVDFVYSAALRQLGGDHHLAQDVTQMVFVDLAKKASALSRHPALLAWLHRCTRYAVFNTRRKEARRSALNKALANDPSIMPPSQPSWHEIGPVLDEVVDELPEKDRAAVLLRFIARKPFADVGRELGVSENAARMRVDRAVEALRTAFERRGIHSTAAALSVLVTAHGISAAPVGVTPFVTTAVATGGAPMSAVVSTFYTMSKIKLSITAVLVGTGAIGLLVEVQSRGGLRAEVTQLSAVVGELAPAQAEHQKLQRELQTLTPNNPDADELARARQRIAILKARPEGVTDARMQPIAPSGRTTPEAAHATFLAAINAGDLATVEQLISFRDGASEQQRAAFMAMFDDPIRRRYRNPEQIFAAAYLGLVAGAAPQTQAITYQVFNTEELFPGVVQVRLWLAGPTGEREDRQALQKTPDGWSIVLRPLIERQAAELRKLLDPVTGLPKATQK
ncbi:MAG: sigma-70 family RNA polymerase sigma factor [Opitutaceae bacterium]